MKNILFVALFATVGLFTQSLRAQITDDTVTFTVKILNPGFVPTVENLQDHLSLVFQQSDLNTIVNQYTITEFNQAYKSSRFSDDHTIYWFRTTSLNLLTELTNAYPDVFAEGQEVPQPVWLYRPNDFGKVFGGRQEALDLVRAEQAWNISKGDTSVIIGMTDDWVDTNHQDLWGKFVRRYPSAPNRGSTHGTFVAGLIAGRTDSDTGLAAIGFRCRIADAYMNDPNMSQMSADGIKILNASWRYGPCYDSLDYSALAGYVEANARYNEIYENGTSTVCAAGNGDIPGILVPGPGSPHAHQIPASLAHNISVTSIGQVRDPILPWDTANHQTSVKDYHLSYFPDPNNNGLYAGFFSTTHNRGVDICAPGYQIKTTVNGVSYYTPPINGGRYDSASGGSSASAPMVAGTIGLMRAYKPCLSPYQVEYVLKNTAANIYAIPANAPFAGKLGAGRLDAFGALSMLTSFNCNNPATSTMYIDGIDINTICNPGQNYNPNALHPTLKPRIINGTPPYKYAWYPMPGNVATLNYYDSAAPQIITATSDTFVYFFLVVKDNSQIQKEAGFRFKIRLRSAIGGGTNWDLAMRDSYFDMLDEPNSQTTFDSRHNYIWASPDLWNRKKKDTGATRLLPENPEYFSSGDSNYMFVRIRNVGCSSSPSSAGNFPKVKLYWTLASTGEQWSRDWINKTATGVGGVTVQVGKEITPTGGITIPSIPAGDSVIIVQGWKPQNPKLYNGGPDSVSACALARIEHLGNNLGMKYKEDTIGSVSGNVRRNNNIVTRNMMVANLGRIRAAKIKYFPVIAAADNEPHYYSLRLSHDQDLYKHFAGNVSDVLYATLKLGALFERWQDGGGHGNFGVLDEGHGSVTYDPATPLQLDSILLNPDEVFELELEFALRDSIFVEFPVTANFHLQQLSTDNEEDKIYGNISYTINVDADDTSGGSSRPNAQTVPRIARHRYQAYPNPATSEINIENLLQRAATVNITVSDVAGKVIIYQEGVALQASIKHPIKVAQLPPGIYLITLDDNDGVSETYKIEKQ